MPPRLTNPYDRAQEHVWGQVAALDEVHAERVAAEQEQAAAQAARPPDVPPLDSHPDVVRKAIKDLEEQLAAVPAWDEAQLAELESEKDYYLDGLDFYKEQWQVVNAYRTEAKRVARAEEMKAKREAAEKAQVHPEEPAKPTDSSSDSSHGTPRKRDTHLLRRKQNSGSTDSG